MKIETAARFIGPNIFCDEPVLHFRIEGLRRQSKHPERAAIGADQRRVLLRLLPGLQSLSGSCDRADFFSQADSGQDFPSGHAIEHLAVALQNLAGSELRCIRSPESGRIRRQSVVVAFEEAEIGEAAVELAAELIEALTARNPAEDDSIVEDFAPRIEAFLGQARRRMLPVQDRNFVKAARERDVPIYRIAGRMLQLGQGCHQSRVSATKTTKTNVVSNDLAANKDFSRRILDNIGLPIPRYARVYRSRDAVRAAEQIGFPVVVKPNQGNMGQAVSVGMRTPGEVADAYKRAREIDRSVLVEEFIEGDDYRILVINGEYCAASKRTPGHVVGDGLSSIEELVAIVNADPRRGTGPRSPWTRIEFDEQADRLLADRDMKRTSVPLEGETVYLRKNANTSDGGTAMDVTDAVHPDNKEIAVRAARAIGLDIAGVDFLTEDIGRSMWRTGGVICEINSRPGLRKHMWPANGPARDIMTPIVDMLYPADQTSRIPVVGVLGIDKRAARGAAGRLADLLEASGRRVGLALNRRVRISAGKRRSPRTSAPSAAQTILLDPDVDIAVLEMTVNDVVRDGLGCDAFDLFIIVSEEADASSTPRASVGRGAAGEAAPEATADDPLSPKIRSALRIIARATRRTILAAGDPALVAAVRAEAGTTEVIEPESVADAPDSDASEAGMDGEAAAYPPRVESLARQAARQLGLRKRDLRRALRSLDPKRRERRALAQRKKRANKASAS